MGTGVEAAGELATGALLGRAVEPAAGEDRPHAHGMCLNCGTALIGAHCHRCGQAGHVHRSLAAIAHEILHGVFHFEGKLWRTLPMLAWRPGELTRRYIEGERARFVSPMAIFLFSLFAMFAVFSWAGLSPPTDLSLGGPQAKIEEARKGLSDRRADAVEELKERDANDPERAKYQAQIAEIDAALNQLPKIKLGSVGGGNFNVSTRYSGWAALDHGIEKWNRNPSLMLYKLQSTGYKFSWLLIPLSLPFVWLLFFWKRQYKLYDHTVFITYSIAFMSLLFIAITLAGEIGVGVQSLALAAVFIPFVHMTRQLKQAYALRWRSAVLRAMVLSFFILIVLLLFLLALLALGMSG
jgi:hypothetical protein